MRSLPIALALSLSLICTATLATSSESEEPQHGRQHASTVYDGLLRRGASGELSTFVNLMNQLFSPQALRQIFGGNASFTVFAPTNEAFDKLFAAMSEEELAELRDLNSGALERLLYFHIARGAWDRPTGALRMLDDNVAQTYLEDGHFKIDQATVLDQARYRNGIVATIDSVLSSQAPELRADATIHFLNCTDEKVFFDMYNGGDIFCLTPRHIAGVDANGGTNSKSCKDNSRGCQIRRASESSPGSCSNMDVYAKNDQTVIYCRFLSPFLFSGQYTSCAALGMPSCAPTP